MHMKAPSTSCLTAQVLTVGHKAHLQRCTGRPQKRKRDVEAEAEADGEDDDEHLAMIKASKV